MHDTFYVLSANARDHFGWALHAARLYGDNAINLVDYNRELNTVEIDDNEPAEKFIALFQLGGFDLKPAMKINDRYNVTPEIEDTFHIRGCVRNRTNILHFDDAFHVHDIDPVLLRSKLKTD